MENPFCLTFAATRDSLMRVENELKSFLATRKIADLDALGVHLAFHEHCVNIIEHGIDAVGGKISEIVATVDVSTHGRFTSIILTVEDVTPVFNPLKAARSDGLGISLIRAISGSIKWENRNGKNVCTFIFPKLQMN